jgi:thiol:disulfide interchange protein DsbC
LSLGVPAVIAAHLFAFPASADPAADKLKTALTRQLPDFTVGEVSASPVKGLYEVDLGSQTAYATADGKYLFTGDLVDIANRVNITESKRGKKILAAVDKMGEKNMIVMGPDKPKRTMTVFTDVDCPYCAKLHQEVPELTKAGVRVRYLLYPRAGVGSDTYKRSVAVWCAADRVKAVGIAKSGGQIDMKTCDNPVAANFELGQSVGITGTPTIVLDNGQVLPGYMPASRLLAGFGLTDEAKPAHP